MTKNQKIFASINALVEAEEIAPELVVSGLEEAVAIACKKHYGIDNVTVIFDMESKRIKISGEKEIVDEQVMGEAFDPTQHIDINEAKETKPNSKVGQTFKYRLKLVPEVMDRSTIATAKQVFRQKLREAKYQKILHDYNDKVGQIVLGNLAEEKNKFMYFKLPGNVEAVLPEKLQTPNEELDPRTPIPLMIEKIEPQSKKGPKIVVSRKRPKIVEYEMTNAIPEIANGMIEIKAIARDAGSRSKVAIAQTSDDDIDIIGSAIGSNGSRINQVKKALGGENIDLIEYFDDEIMFISNALAPALVTAVQILDLEEKVSRVIVPDDQLSLAIGGGGQNVRLASQLTDWKIDIESESDAQAAGINYEDDII